MRKAPWNDAENGALVALYFAMLDKAISGQHYNKAAMIRLAQGIDQPDPRNEQERTGQLEARTRGSIEAKLMNATAAHLDVSRDVTGEITTMAGYGYVPLSLKNYTPGGRGRASGGEVTRYTMEGQTSR